MVFVLAMKFGTRDFDSCYSKTKSGNGIDGKLYQIILTV